MSFEFSRRIFFWISMILILSSCKIKDRVVDTLYVLPIHRIDCFKDDQPNHFFSLREGEPFPYEYTTIAILNATSGNQPKINPIKAIKKEAIKQCADGIIKIHQKNELGSYNTVDIVASRNQSDDGVEQRNYPRTTYTALAIKLKDSTMKANIPADTNFLNEQKKREQKPIRPDECLSCSAKKGSKGLLIGGGSMILAFLTAVFFINR